MNFVDQATELKAKFFSIRETRPASHIYVLLDRACPVAPEHPLHPTQLAARPIQREQVVVTHKPQKPDPASDEWPPILLQLYRAGESGYLDEELIDLSLATAIERCASVNGAYVAAWIASDLAPQALALHLARSCEVFDFHRGCRRHIPLYEPHRMALLFDDPEATGFLRAYLSQIHLYGFVDAAGVLRTSTSIEAPAAQEHAAARLSLAQCRMQSRIPLARLVLLGLRKAGQPIPSAVERKVDALVAEANRLGLSHAEDVVFFALNGLSLSSDWHEHPQARHCIACSRDEGAPLAGLIGELPEAVLDDIGRYRLPQ